MGYNALAERLASEADPRRVTAFPDGSVDEYYVAYDGEENRITERKSFGDAIARSEYDSFPVERESREAAGQAPNVARQAHALGAETTLYGYLEDPVFADLPFETVSMGEPARIDVFAFEDDDLLLSERSETVGNWTLEDLTEATGEKPRDALAADALCCGNWASIEGLTDALATLADGPLEADTFVLDPGPVSVRSSDDVSRLLEVLGDLESRTDVVYSVNRAELEATVTAISSGEAGEDDENLRTVRETAEITAAVLHESEVASAATREGVIALKNLSVDEPRRRTGAGDRFSAGVAVGLARDWEWETVLALGNCCAAYYVETARTGDRDDLRAFLAEERRRG
ncbi:PfkB family carbohydrate kinase [Natronobacterium texcoconense]|uniref:Sugar or nucleoside kinase, ribokinase family n=1 Tax=Natronobacterium texcoconense TaxID=1095778 RepID=A0A1H1GS41_NATTX|nr:PfkB family carbohydrate kinase [Natronobacterium texcoconense]SDR15971.1 Sugar or nucleoside kinase, ribokinase family [Natronobacterium texcoconense]